MAKGSSKGASKVAPVDPRLASAPPAKGGPCGLCCGSREPAYKPGQSAEEASEQRDQARKARVARRRERRRQARKILETLHLDRCSTYLGIDSDDDMPGAGGDDDAGYLGEKIIGHFPGGRIKIRIGDAFGGEGIKDPGVEKLLREAIDMLDIEARARAPRARGKGGMATG